MMRAAYRADGGLVERSAFYALACDPRRSVVVEACAGAGKTWMLVSRILRALLDGAQPHEILAITFTRKAAGEMRERLAEWLRDFAAPTTSAAQRVDALVLRGLSPREAHELAPALAGLHERLLQGGRPVEIRTFHAWFMQLQRAAPIELLDEIGLPADAELIEKLEEHRDEVHRRFHAALGRDEALRRDHAALIAARGRYQVRQWLDAAWDRRIEVELADAAGVLDDSVPPAHRRWPELAALEHPAQVLLSPAWTTTLRELARRLGQGGRKALDAAATLERALDADDAEQRFAHASDALFTQKGEPRKLGATAGLAEAQAELQVVVAQASQHEAHVEHRRMVRLTRRLLAVYAAYKRERGLVDMSDLERCALMMLRDATLAGWVQERLDARVRHLLIDEFQDTSPLQWHALHAWLSGYAGAGGGASGQRPPGVFIVGDPKQSIYRFRRAEPRVFDAARSFVTEALGGHALECDHTRRNAPGVLEVLNPVFDAAQRAAEFAGFRAHSTEVEAIGGAALRTLPRVLRPARAAPAAGELSPWRDSLTTPRHEPEQVLREQEAAGVAAAIADLLAGGEAAPGEIFVLCRKRESLRLAAAALQALHVPYAAVEDQALMEAPEAADLVALLDALASPRHALSLARALRSPLFGAGDADLAALAQHAAGVGGSWWHALMDLPAPSHALARARALLVRWRVSATQLPPHDLLDRIVHEGDLRARIAATAPREHRRAALDAIDALLGQALALDGGRGATPYRFVRALRRRAVEVQMPAFEDAVQLLTIHGAKGLEARVVFVMDSDPEAANAETTTLLVDWPVEHEAPRSCAFVYAESACPPALAETLALERAARAREELNGLYVAMTRAREQLVFSATEPFRRSAGATWWQRVEALALPWEPPRAAPQHPDGAAADPTLMLHDLPAWTPPPPAPDGPPDSPSTAATRLGQAVHRVLEWAGRPGRGGDAAEPAALCDAAAREFAADAAEVETLARTILASPACARFFDARALRWAGNEVDVAEGGDALRIDRLVALDEGGETVWWVLDYKLNAAPQALESNRAQLARYRRAVQAAQPGARVRAAFITGRGELIEPG